MQFERLNPLDGSVASSAAAMQAAEIPAIAAKAGAAFPAWAAQGPNARRAVLMKAAAALEARADAFVEAMMGEIGATKGWALFNLGLAASMVREAAALTTQISGEVIPSDKPGCIAMALREPVGVILGIARGMRRSSWVCAPSPCRWPAATPSFSRRRNSARAPTP
jgi:acyl-CoA reductase-like NAD-dependent aldehyde dehydrogenase